MGETCPLLHQGPQRNFKKWGMVGRRGEETRQRGAQSCHRWLVARQGLDWVLLSSSPCVINILEENSWILTRKVSYYLHYFARAAVTKSPKGNNSNNRKFCLIVLEARCPRSQGWLPLREGAVPGSVLWLVGGLLCVRMVFALYSCVCPNCLFLHPAVLN